jgi:hypothetical protein
MPYQGPQDFSDMEYDGLVAFAQQSVNPILAKYSKTVACEDALNLAIRSYNQGQFDGKVNAGRFNVLLGALKDKTGPAQVSVQAKKEEKKKDVKVTQQTLKNLGLKREKIPHAFQVGPKVKGPTLIREHGNIVLKKKDK